MRAATIDRVQARIWRRLGDDVEVFDSPDDLTPGNGDWTGLAIRDVDRTVESPDGEGITFEEAIRGFSFRLTDAPGEFLHLGSVIRLGTQFFTVDGNRQPGRGYHSCGGA